MKCLYCQEDCADIAGNEYMCLNHHGTLVTFYKDNYIQFNLPYYIIHLFPDGFVVYERNQVGWKTNKIVLDLNFVPPNITPESISDKLKLYLTFQ